MPQPPIEIELSPRVGRKGRPWFILIAIINLLLGGCGLALVGLMWLTVAVRGWDGPTTPAPWQAVLATIVLGSASAVMLTGGIRVLRLAPPRESGAVQAMCAFVIDGDVIRFPTMFNRRAEDWPLRATVVHYPSGRLKSLRLTCPGFSPRTYPPGSFTLPLETISAVVERQKRGLDRLDPGDD